jgi:single-strand DNA-binding protein
MKKPADETPASSIPDEQKGDAMFQISVLVGHLGQDPEMRYTPRGSPYTSFPIATNRRYTDAEGRLVEETTWWRVTTWGKLAENCRQYLKKSRLVLVVGVAVSDRSTGGPRIYKRKNGDPGASHEINAEYVRFLDKGEGNGAGPEAGTGEPPPGEEIPF